LKSVSSVEIELFSKRYVSFKSKNILECEKNVKKEQKIICFYSGEEEIIVFLHPIF
jgi:hypothetical protein